MVNMGGYPKPLEKPYYGHHPRANAGRVTAPYQGRSKEVEYVITLTYKTEAEANEMAEWLAGVFAEGDAE
jgi:hypothetical protein